MKSTGFHEENRITVDSDDIHFLILPRLMAAAQEVDAQVRLKRSETSPGESSHPGGRRRENLAGEIPGED